MRRRVVSSCVLIGRTGGVSGWIVFVIVIVILAVVVDVFVTVVVTWMKEVSKTENVVSTVLVT